MGAAPVIWVEILARHRAVHSGEVAARHRCEAAIVRIGRGYDNDIVLDDPYVAPRHLVIRRDEFGTLVAEDQGSLNGIRVGRGKRRLARVAIDGAQTIRIGQTELRIRDGAAAVAPERALAERGHAWPGVVALAPALLGFEALRLYLGETSEAKLSLYLSPLLGLTALALGWTALWSILCRIFAGQARFERNLLIALAGALAYFIAGELVTVASFALAMPGLTQIQSIGVWLLLGLVCFLHLRAIGPSRLLLKGGVVTLVIAGALTLQWVQQRDFRAAMGSSDDRIRHLLPPALRLTPPQSEAGFFGAVDALKGKLEAARREEPAAGRVAGIFFGDDE